MTHQSEVALTRAPAFTSPSMQAAPAWRGRAAAVGWDVLLLCAIVFSIPIVVLGIGIPIALFVQVLLWVGRLF